MRARIHQRNSLKKAPGDPSQGLSLSRSATMTGCGMPFNTPGAMVLSLRGGRKILPRRSRHARRSTRLLELERLTGIPRISGPCPWWTDEELKKRESTALNLEETVRVPRREPTRSGFRSPVDPAVWCKG